MSKEIILKSPEFLTIAHYEQLQDIEHLSDLQKTVKIISVLAGVEEDLINDFDLSNLSYLANEFMTNINSKEEFYPVFEIDGTMYGFTNLNKMKLGEFVDLEMLAKEPNKNIAEIMAILYRPITREQFSHKHFKQRHKVKVVLDKSDNIFKYYDVEKYNNETRFENSRKLAEVMPITFALGALGFFLGLAQLYLTNTLPYSKELEGTMKKVNLMTTQKTLSHLVSIGGGLRRFINSPKAVSLTSLETEPSLI